MTLMTLITLITLMILMNDDPDEPDDPVAAAVLLMSDRIAMFTGSSFLSCHFREQYHSIVHKEHTYNPLF